MFCDHLSGDVFRFFSRSTFQEFNESKKTRVLNARLYVKRIIYTYKTTQEYKIITNTSWHLCDVRYIPIYFIIFILYPMENAMVLFMFTSQQRLLGEILKEVKRRNYVIYFMSALFLLLLFV